MSQQQVFLGWPLFCLPRGFHVRACLAVLEAGLRRACPVRSHLVFLISSAVGGWCILCYWSVLLMSGGVWPAGPPLPLVSVCSCSRLIIVSKLFFRAVSIPSSDTQMCVCVCMCVSVVSVTVKHPVLPPCAVDGRARNLYYYYYVYLWSCRIPFPLPPPPKMTVEESEYHRQKQFKQVGQPLLPVKPVCCSCVANTLSVCSQKNLYIMHIV